MPNKIATGSGNAPSIPAADGARFEGIGSQKAATEYRDCLNREYPEAATILDGVFSDEAIRNQWASKR